MTSSAAGVARLSFLIDLSALPAPDPGVRRGVAEIASVGLGVTWGVGGEDQAKLAAEAGGEHSDAAVLASGTDPTDRRRAAQLAKSRSIDAVVFPVDASAPSVRLRCVATGLWECTPNRVWSPERRLLWGRGGQSHLFRAADAHGLSGASVVFVGIDAVATDKTRSKLIGDLRKVAELAKDGALAVLPLGGLIDEQDAATKGRPQKSILRAA